MKEEDNLRKLVNDKQPYKWVKPIHSMPKEVYNLCWRLLEISYSSLVIRSYNIQYNLADDNTFLTYESVGAHTNLTLAIVDAALDYLYGDDDISPSNYQVWTTDGYSRREVNEAIRIHDLPENIMGDLPDNNSRDEAAKRDTEERYFRHYLSTFNVEKDYSKFTNNVYNLVTNMSPDSELPTGRLLFLADKVAAIIATLCLDYEEISPLIRINDISASDKDIAEMSICDESHDGWYRASEMWTTDFFRIRKLNEIDVSGFFTAIIVMTTLIVNHTWYLWRRTDYAAAYLADAIVTLPEAELASKSDPASTVEPIDGEEMDSASSNLRTEQAESVDSPTV